MPPDRLTAADATGAGLPARKKPRLLAIASGGGHWDELLVLRPAFDDFDVVYATTMAGQAERDGIDAVLVTDSNRNSGPMATLTTAWHMLKLIWRYRPSAVVSTGAMPGLMAIVFSKAFGARTIWIDSVANAEQLSLSGKWAARIVDLHLTQWPHLATEKTKYLGSVL